MKYAEKVSEIPNAFKNSPLEENELEEFYCDGTMEFRVGDEYTSPIRDIYEACQIPSDQNAFLLLGHKGCGKSTELNKMSADLKEKGYKVLKIQCAKDLDMMNPRYADLLILMGDALLHLAEELECNLKKEILDRVASFWTSEIEEVKTITESDSMTVEAGLKAESPRFLASILQFFTSAKADLKFNEIKREDYRNRIIQRPSDWLLSLRQISDEITGRLNGKQPIIIFEDLDKIDPEDAWNVFSNHASKLTGVSFPVIYTFPIALFYDPRFAALGGYFTIKTFPMIKPETIDGEVYDDGIGVINKIVQMRADLGLFEEDVLETLIKKTGGSLRDLFYVINTCAKRANRRESATISIEDTRVALNELRSSLTSRIDGHDYPFLANIYNGNRQQIDDKKELLLMMQANVVLEYNGDRWHNVHPLVAEFLVEQGLV